MKIRMLSAAVAAAMVLPGAAWATNGYFSHGYGMKAKGMGGAATAMASDAFGGANNPASMVWAGNRLDLGIDWFNPNRSASRSTSTLAASSDSGTNDFYLPEFGYNRMINSKLSLGLTVYANGGMNTNYSSGNTNCVAFGGTVGKNILCGNSSLGVELGQLIFAPTLSYKLNEKHSVGVSPLFGYQQFSADGLQAFAGISSDANNLTNRGMDDTTGWGVRFGWQGKLTDTVTVGAAYSSKINMGKLDKYKGLFAEQGNFDVPANWNIGVAFQPTKQWTIALDYQHIAYGDVKAVSNSSRLACTNGAPTQSTCLGGSNGIGFGWSDVDVWKLGAEYRYSDKLTLRAGLNHGDNPISAADITFNFLAPGVIRDHLSLGFSYQVAPASEISMSYTHAFKNSVSGIGNNPNFNHGGQEKIEMDQNVLGISWGTKM